MTALFSQRRYRKQVKIICLFLFFSEFDGILTGDDNLAVFADGRLVGYNGGTSNAAGWFSFPRETKVITVFVYNGPNGFGGFLGVFRVVTDSSWKSNESSIKPDDGWKETNFTDNTWLNTFVRQDNSGRLSSTRVIRIPNDVHCISAENHEAPRFVCRRRFSKEERLSKSSKYSVSPFPASTIVNLSKLALKQLHCTYIQRLDRILSILRRLLLWCNPDFTIRQGEDKIISLT